LNWSRGSRGGETGAANPVDNGPVGNEIVGNKVAGNEFVANQVAVSAGGCMIQNIAGPPVSGQNLFGREAEIRGLWEKFESGQNVLMLAPRRVGKTSLMHELKRAPRPGWVVFYSDLERGSELGDCITDMIAHLAKEPRTRSWMESLDEKLPFRNTITHIFRRKVALGHEQFKFELGEAVAEDPETTQAQLLKRLQTLPKDIRLLFIQDELPIVIATMLKSTTGRTDVERLLAWHRALRQDPGLQGRVQFLVGGSIGLSGVLRRHNMSGPINDLNIFKVDPWPEETACNFLDSIGRSLHFFLSEEAKTEILRLLGEAVPYHVQLFFQHLRDICREDPKLVSNATILETFTARLAGPDGGPHLDHYDERLGHLLSEDKAELARRILTTVARDEAGQPLSFLNDEAIGRAEDARDASRFLLDEGYLIERESRLRFRSNLLREYWRRRRG
jgi:uncharacterized protein